MAGGEAFHAGDIVAMAVAETEEIARDAIEAIGVAWEPLDAVVDMREAMRDAAPELFSGAPGNVAYDNHFGDAAATDAIFANAAHVVRLDAVNNRLIANYVETRGAVAEYDSARRHFTLHVASQGVHGLRDLIADEILRISRDSLRVVTPDVGGGFGTKLLLYREYPLLLEAARRLGRPVRWIADRSEHFLGDAQARDNVTRAEMALDAEGRFLALRLDILSNLGGYPSQTGPYVAYVGASMATGVYDIGALHARVRGVYTHTIPVDAYRGAGNPEATYVLERLADQCARQLGMPPEEIRARNFIKPERMPYRTQTGRVYDAGEFEGAMRASLANADRAGFEARVVEATTRGKLRGFGFACYIEATAWGDGEEGSIQLDPDGDFTVLIGTQSTGQGHQTAYAQVASHYFDVPLHRVRVVQGDTDRVRTGAGTGGSRSIPIGAVMLGRASEKLVATLKDLAADRLEADVRDLEIAGGAIRVAGTDRAIDFLEIAKLPGATAERLKSVDAFTPPDATYPNGTHCCEVEIDPETGAVRIERYTVVDDFGVTLNPMLLRGQAHGGIAQGVGQALLEGAVYSEDGALMTGNLLDYGVPRAGDLPNIHFETRNVPSTTNPMGLKGAGEAGSVAAPPAVINALADALWRAYGACEIDMPATPLSVFRAIRKASGGG
jgi:carbon-monoxide dehydrogenase large subunit